MSQTDSTVTSICKDCDKPFQTEIEKTSVGYFPKDCRCPTCKILHEDYRREEAQHEAYLDAKYERMLAEGLIDENGNEIDE
jgi:phage FluMu protein Com